MDPPAFIVANTEIQSPALLPEISLHLASEGMALWQMSDEDRAEEELPLPYWAFAWAGGQALARHLLDNWEVVRGKRVLDVGPSVDLKPSPPPWPARRRLRRSTSIPTPSRQLG